MTSFALAGDGRTAHLHALSLRAAGPRVGSCDLVAVSSQDTDRARTLADEHGAAVVETTALPAGADIVVVATPAGDHVRPALHAAAGGAAVLVDTPLCTTLEDADRLVRVAEAGAAMTYAENLLFAPAVIMTLRDIAGLGHLGHLSVRMAQDEPTSTEGDDGGVLLDLGVQALALVLRAVVADAPAAVRGVLEFSDDGLVADRAHATVEFASGLSASIDVSWRETAVDWHLQAASESGVVHLELRPELRLERSGEAVELPSSGDDGALRDFGYVDQICETVYGFRAQRGVATSTAAFGRQVLDMACAVAESAGKGGEAVAVPYAGPRHLTPSQIYEANRS